MVCRIEVPFQLLCTFKSVPNPVPFTVNRDAFSSLWFGPLCFMEIVSRVCNAENFLEQLYTSSRNIFTPKLAHICRSLWMEEPVVEFASSFVWGTTRVTEMVIKHFVNKKNWCIIKKKELIISLQIHKMSQKIYII